jgi:uncharacterized BrkB/YihY/UPF0761 family membrane protein
VNRLDAFQRRYSITAFIYAVQKKFGDDRGGYLAALVTYYGFLSVFPLLLAAFTIVAYALSGDHSTVTSLERHISGYPIIGPAASQLQGQTLKGSPAAIAVGVLVLIWGSIGLLRWRSSQCRKPPFRSSRPGAQPGAVPDHVPHPHSPSGQSAPAGPRRRFPPARAGRF